MRIGRVVLLVALVLGLLGGIAPTASAQGCAATYVVQPGDNLFRIALKFGLTTDVVARANNIFNPNAIYVGQVLCIPGGVVYPPPPPPPPPSACTWYTVKRGDSLGTIALAYRTTIGAIQRANNIANPNLIYVGMTLCIPVAAPPPASFPQWKGEYFNNPDLAGAPSVARNDKAINFDWGIGWPNPKINADNFSVRWTRLLAFKAGTFRFSARADDGIRVFVDNVLIIDEWHAATTTTYTQDVTLATGTHALRVEYYEATGAASAAVTWVRTTGGPGPTPTPLPGVTPTPVTGGGGVWTACYFSNVNRDVSGQPTLCRFEPAIAINWGEGSPDPLISRDLFAARWSSVQNFQAGTYRFFALVDDGARIFVDDKPVVNEWFEHPGSTIFGDVTLTAGAHNVRVEYFEFGHTAQIYVWWEKR